MDATLKFQAQQYLANDGMLSHFISRSQRIALRDLMNGEEGEFFVAKVHEIVKTIRNMSKPYQTDGQGEEAIVHLHYFRGSVDAWIIERDADEMPDNGSNGVEHFDTPQHQAFGKITLTGDKNDAELGYISIEELIANGVELDLYWTPKKLKEV